MDDTRILLEEQNEKNEHLERKFRKVDSELIEVIRKIKSCCPRSFVQRIPMTNLGQLDLFR